jgi:hypothetical protein
MIIKMLAFLGVASYQAKRREREEREEIEFYARLNNVVERARVVSITPYRNACGLGPNGPLSEEQTRAVVRLSELAVARDAA